MKQIYVGAFLFLWGLFIALYNRRAAHHAIKFHSQFNYRPGGKEVNETVGRIAYLIGGVFLMILGGLIVTDGYLSK